MASAAASTFAGEFDGYAVGPAVVMRFLRSSTSARTALRSSTQIDPTRAPTSPLAASLCVCLWLSRSKRDASAMPIQSPSWPPDVSTTSSTRPVRVAPATYTRGRALYGPRAAAVMRPGRHVPAGDQREHRAI